MTKILFVCHGNICRSPMAEFILKDMTTRAGIKHLFEIASAATSYEEIGNEIYFAAKRKLAEHGITAVGKTARKIQREDYGRWDVLIGFDKENIQKMKEYFGGDPERKIHLLMDYTEKPNIVIEDPWYTGDFDRAWDDICEGCLGLLNSLVPIVTVDFSDCRSREDLYKIISERMLWQREYGHNLDALYDILTGLPHLGKSIHVILPKESAPCYNYAQIMLQVIQEAEASV